MADTGAAIASPGQPAVSHAGTNLAAVGTPRLTVALDEPLWLQPGELVLRERLFECAGKLRCVPTGRRLEDMEVNSKIQAAALLLRCEPEDFLAHAEWANRKLVVIAKSGQKFVYSLEHLMAPLQRVAGKAAGGMARSTSGAAPAPAAQSSPDNPSRRSNSAVKRASKQRKPGSARDIVQYAAQQA